ncbi:MAG: FAD:protein FMN transferase [Clostridiales bacterium]|nr:FAD:protein FMN transferase [Clostridiales bacterium]
MKKIALLALSCILITACSKQESVKQSEFMLDTICTITVYNENNKEKTADELISEAFELCSDYENILSRTIEGSDVYNINNAGGNPIEVSDCTIEILEAAKYYSELSDGAFDITTAPLSILWDFEGDDPHVPAAEDIETEKAKIDYTKIKIEGNTVTLEAPVEAIDLGAIAKGYITDKLAEYLTENGVTSAIISLGGNIYAIGENEIDDRPFNLGIQDPKAEDGSIIGYVTTADKSLVTSGDYQRYFEEDGVRYHHILDPATGYPADSGVCSVTIISDKSVDGDALSTSCFVLGLDEGMELINSLDGIDAVFIDNDGNMYFSDGFENGEIEYTSADSAE